MYNGSGVPSWFMRRRFGSGGAKTNGGCGVNDRSWSNCRIWYIPHGIVAMFPFSTQADSSSDMRPIMRLFANRWGGRD